MSDRPLLSVVIPVHNRASLVRRAVASVLRQPGSSYEIVIVDDGSTDGSLTAALEEGGGRVRGIALHPNRGVGAARNAGVAAARGEWVVFLDSDDELTADALAVIAHHARAAEEDVAKLFLRCRLSDGSLSPSIVEDATVDYVGYLRWLERNLGGSYESLPVARREAMGELPYHDGAWPEGLHHFDFARRFRTRLCVDVVREYRDDAPNRLMSTTAEGLLARAPQVADHAAALLMAHGDMLAAHAPRWHTMMRREHLLFCALAGRRSPVVREILDMDGALPARLFVGLVVSIAMLSPRLVAHLLAWRRRRS